MTQKNNSDPTLIERLRQGNLCSFRPTMIEAEDTLERWGGFNYGKRQPERRTRLSESEIAEIARIYLEQMREAS